MAVVVEQVPEALQADVDAALAWLNRERGSRFRVTGVVDPERALARPEGEPRELGLVLCEGDTCLHEQLRIRRGSAGFEVAIAANGAAGGDVVPPHLDPPAGVRLGWLDEQLKNHAFVLLVFYRGFW